MFKGDMGQAQQWAAYPPGVQQNINNANRVVGQMATDLFTPEEYIAARQAVPNIIVMPSVAGWPTPQPQAVPPPGDPAATPSRLEGYGAKPVQGKPGVYADAKGRHFKEEGGRVLQWSPSANKWVDITDRLTAK